MHVYGCIYAWGKLSKARWMKLLFRQVHYHVHAPLGPNVKFTMHFERFTPSNYSGFFIFLGRQINNNINRLTKAQHRLLHVCTWINGTHNNVNCEMLEVWLAVNSLREVVADVECCVLVPFSMTWDVYCEDVASSCNFALLLVLLLLWLNTFCNILVFIWKKFGTGMTPQNQLARSIFSICQLPSLYITLTQPSLHENKILFILPSFYYHTLLSLSFQ